MPSLPDSGHVAVDVETSGLSPARGGRVIEVAAVAVRGGAIVAEFATLIDAPCRIHYGAQRVHGISAGMLRGQPPPTIAWRRFLDFVGPAPLIAHNARFDIAFLRFELAQLGLPLPNRSICTLTLSRKLHPHLSSHRLEAVAGHLLGDLPADCRLHRALDDARLAARVWLALAGGVRGGHGGIRGGHMGPPLRGMP